MCHIATFCDDACKSAPNLGHKQICQIPGPSSAASSAADPMEIDEAGPGIAPASLNNDLIAACKNGQSDEVGRLLELGADPDTQRSSGMSCLHYAAIQGSIEIVKSLLEKKAHINHQNIEGQTALLAASLTKDRAHRDIVDLLLKSKADLSVTNHYGNAYYK